MTPEEAMRLLQLDKVPMDETLIKGAFRKVASQFHPDRYATTDDQARATELLKQFSIAKDVLLDSLTTSEDCSFTEHAYSEPAEPSYEDPYQPPYETSYSATSSQARPRSRGFWGFFGHMISSVYQFQGSPIIGWSLWVLTLLGGIHVQNNPVIELLLIPPVSASGWSIWTLIKHRHSLSLTTFSAVAHHVWEHFEPVGRVITVTYLIGVVLYLVIYFAILAIGVLIFLGLILGAVLMVLKGVFGGRR